MGQFRQPYGWALGFENQFHTAAATTANDISGSATPNVTLGNLFYTNNTAALTITGFVLNNTDTRAVQYEGKMIRLFLLDGSTQIDNASNIFLQGTDNLIGANSIVDFMYSRGSWYQTGGANNNRTEVQAYTVSATSSINVDRTSLAIVSQTGGVTTFISAFSGGQVGQNVRLTSGTGSTIALIVQTGGNIVIHGTNAYAVNTATIYEFSKVNGTTWRMHYIGTMGN